MVHGHLASHVIKLNNSSKRLDALEQRLTDFHKTVELRLEGMSFDQARQDYDRCEARAQTDQKLDLISKYMAGFDCEISEMKIKAREMKTTIDAMAHMSFGPAAEWIVQFPLSLRRQIWRLRMLDKMSS